MASENYNIIALNSEGENTTTVNLSSAVITITTRYNYSAECWSMDVLDVDGEAIITGVMLVPNIDLLAPYPAIKASIGTFLVVEKNDGDYKSPSLLGTNVLLLWFAADEDVVIPT